ncbi:MAG TPA: hypothetical protein VGM88_34155 [Kofleriaceae bacterium]
MRALLAIALAAGGIAVGFACSHTTSDATAPAAPRDPAVPPPSPTSDPLPPQPPSGPTVPNPDPLPSDAGVVPSPGGPPVLPDVPHASLHGRSAVHVAEVPLDAGVTRDALLPIPDVGRPLPVDASGPTPQPSGHP